MKKHNHTSNGDNCVSYSPSEGDLKQENGVWYIFRCGSWTLDAILNNTFDRHHHYSGHQDPKKPLRVAGSHITCGARLFR
jgi:hypothetical protein